MIVLAAFSVSAPASYGALPPVPKGAHLLTHNRFESPKEVLGYFLERESYGFVWTGLDSAERREFTTWNESPIPEEFLVARRYSVGEEGAPSATEAAYTVRYELEARVSASGAVMPLASVLSVKYRLRKVGGQWKIASPAPDEIIPVLARKALNGGK